MNLIGGDPMIHPREDNERLIRRGIVLRSTDDGPTRAMRVRVCIERNTMMFKRVFVCRGVNWIKQHATSSVYTAGSSEVKSVMGRPLNSPCGWPPNADTSRFLRHATHPRFSTLNWKHRVDDTVDPRQLGDNPSIPNLIPWKTCGDRFAIDETKWEFLTGIDSLQHVEYNEFEEIFIWKYKVQLLDGYSLQDTKEEASFLRPVE